MDDVSASTPCSGCGAHVYDDAAFCHACGRALRQEAGVLRVVDGALRATQAGARVVMQNPTAQKVAGGAVLGAGAAILVPFVTMGAGAALGAAYVGYTLFKKKG